MLKLKIKDIFNKCLGILYKVPKYIYISFTLLLMFYFFCFHYNNVHEIGIRRNIITGELSLDKNPGMYISAPWVQVAKIDTRPQRLCIDCGCKNMTCKLVIFNVDNWLDFVDREGFRYYWWSNRFSFNISHENEYRGMEDILRGYTFDDTEDYTFIEIEKEL